MGRGTQQYETTSYFPPMVRTTGNDGREQRLIDDIARHGWHIVASEQNSTGPAHAYSVGLFHTFGHPEVLILGLHGATTMARLIEGIGQQVRQGTKFQDWHESDALLDGYRCLFRELPSDIFCDYLSEAIWFYRGDSFPALQCFWPDREHRYPWQPKCRPGVVRRQPILPDPSDWPFAVGKNRTAHVSANVLAGAEAIVRASHNHDGTWTFVGEAAADSVDTKTATLAELLNRQPILGNLAELSAGWQATRDAQSDHWHVLPLPTPVDESVGLSDVWDAEQEDADQEDADREDAEQEDAAQEDTVEDAEQAVVAHEDTEQDADETWDDEPWDDEPADEEPCDIAPLPALRPELLLPAEELPLTLRQQARKRRRPGPRLWPQWSLRTWLILFTVFALFFGVIAYLRSPRPILRGLRQWMHAE
jgi:hypothetical protein